MRILVTNDDSISATQLLPLARWCQKLGEVTVVVPKYEQSGKSHSIELHKAFEVKKVMVEDVEITTVDSSPADCVRFAVMGMKKEFDLVISGINKGLNMGTDIMYSGTAAAVFEAANLGIKAVAVSVQPSKYDHATEPLDDVLAYFREHKLFEKCGIYNVNVVPGGKGIRITRQGGPYFLETFQTLENDMYMPVGKPIQSVGTDLTLDTVAHRQGYISISPMTTDRTNHSLFRELEKLNN